MIEELRQQISQDVQENVPLALFTTFRIVDQLNII